MHNVIKVLIADDHAVVRVGLMTLLEYEPGIKVVGEADDGNHAVQLARALKPDIVIMDLMMPCLDGVEATKRIKAVDPDIKVLILTSYGSSDDIRRAICAGACGAIVKHTANEKLIEAIRLAAQGKRIYSPDVTCPQISHDDESEDTSSSLTERQLEVLEAMAQGFSNHDIALRLDISKDMVKAHAKRLLRKLNAANRTEAVAIALRKHLLKI